MPFNFSVNSFRFLIIKKVVALAISKFLYFLYLIKNNIVIFNIIIK